MDYLTVERPKTLFPETLAKHRNSKVHPISNFFLSPFNNKISLCFLLPDGTGEWLRHPDTQCRG